MKAFEDLFLYYNIPAEAVKKINQNIMAVKDAIKETADSCKRVFFDKEPDNL